MPDITNFIEKNQQTLEKELDWFNRVLETRIALYFKNDCRFRSIREIDCPVVDTDDSPYAELIKANRFGFDERIILILALIPHIRLMCNSRGEPV
jgi:hypothetical protein